MMNFKIVPIQQRTPEWYEFKKDKISASMTAAIMGVNPWMTPLQLYHHIQEEIQSPLNKAMEQGIYLEPFALEQFNATASCKYEPAVIQSVEYPQLMASLDGLGWLKGKPVALEIKCPSKREIHLQISEGKIPDYYLTQCNMAMMLLDISWMTLFSFFEEEGNAVEVQRDEDLIKKMKPKLLEFHDRLINFDPPPATEKDWYEWEDKTWITRANIYQQTLRSLKLLEEDAKNLRKELIENAPHSLVKVGPLRMTKYLAKGLVDWDKVCEEYAIDREKYRKESIEKWLLKEDVNG